MLGKAQWLTDRCMQALDDELKGPMEEVEMSRERAQRLALQEASIALVTSLLPALEPVEQVMLLRTWDTGFEDSGLGVAESLGPRCLRAYVGCRMLASSYTVQHQLSGASLEPCGLTQMLPRSDPGAVVAYCCSGLGACSWHCSLALCTLQTSCMSDSKTHTT